MIDFKISPFIVNGRTTGTVHVYEGAVTTENEMIDGVLKPITRYRRSAKLRSFGLDLSGEYNILELTRTARQLLSQTEIDSLIQQIKNA